MKTLTRKDIFVQKLKGRPIHVYGEYGISNKDILLLLECNIIRRFLVPTPENQKNRYCVLHCIHLAHTHLSPAGNWLESTKIIEPGMWV